MKKILLFTVVIFSCFSAFSQKWQRVGINGLVFPDGKPDTFDVSGFKALNDTTLFLYGERTFFVSRDAGATWKKVLNYDVHIYNVHFFDKDTGIASGDSIFQGFNWGNGLLLKTVDGGKTWKKISHPSIGGVSTGEISAISFKNSDEFAIGSNTGVAKTTDGGKTWITTRRSIWGAAHNGVNCYGDSFIFARGFGSSAIGFSEDNGKTWQDITNIYEDTNQTYRATLYSVWFAPGNRLGYMQTSSWISSTYHTKNGGKTWLPLTTPAPYYFLDSVTGWAAGDSLRRFQIVNDSVTRWDFDNTAINQFTDTTRKLGTLSMFSPEKGFMLVRIAGIFHVYRFGPVSTGSNKVTGKVYADNNNNNQFDPLVDVPLPNIVVTVPQLSLLTTADMNGNYTFHLDSGNYTLKLMRPTAYQGTVAFASPVTGELNINVTGSYQNFPGNDFLCKPLKLKPRVSVNVSTGSRRRCFTTTGVIRYENFSLVPAHNTKIKLVFPELLRFVSADKSYTVDANGDYIFSLGTLDALGSGQINFTDSVICGDETIRNLTACVKVYIYADSVDYGGDTAIWDKSEIIANARCINGWINFQLVNTTPYPMADSAELRYFSNTTLKDIKKYKLGANDTLNLTIKADFRTWRIEADQRPGHPLSQYVQATVEGCRGNGNGIVNTFMVNRLPVNDFRHKKSVYCELITDSYDPNDKTVYPQGLGDNNCVKPGTPLTYRVRFQNTGSAPAIRVVVKDTLPDDLDLSTFSFGGASHNYTYKLTGKGKAVLEVTFNNIYLPDSTTDKKGSNGFFAYTVHHKAGIAEDTRIDNKAYIYFDYNSAVITNTASVTIKDTVPTLIEPVNPETKLPFIIKGYAKDTVCKGDTIRITIIGQGPYNWTKLREGVSLGTGHELEMIVDATTTFTGYTADGSANFMVLVKDCVNSGPNAIDEVGSAGIDIYPNPSSDGIFTITGTEGIKTIRVIDITGREAGAVMDNTIRLINSASGVYFVVITDSEGNTYYKKLVKE
ncbi:MAG TPA: T9SS type A sorting domain-containing protein [Bacteroidia bacterium]|nr:T9SS type A sorting domain-containing protein [Bacteroidia bacterium]